jgi:hypothetical protein
MYWNCWWLLFGTGAVHMLGPKREFVALVIRR